LKRKVFSALVFVAVVLLAAVLSYYGFVSPRQPAPGPAGLPWHVNARNACVGTPTLTEGFPPQATAHCRDETWYFTQTRRGACAAHGGVAEWTQTRREAELLNLLTMKQVAPGSRFVLLPRPKRGQSPNSRIGRQTVRGDVSEDADKNCELD
jgi:Protein of unknown function (DUF3761)